MLKKRFLAFIVIVIAAVGINIALSPQAAHAKVTNTASQAPDAPMSAAELFTISVPSQYIVSPASVTIALPEGYRDADNTDTYPVVYLLNGHGGDNLSWSKIIKLDSLATEFDIIIVCPDGRNSWYWDSPIDSTMQMESYITRELVPYIDANYRTRADRTGRAITGLSMGGHGGLWLGIRHSDIFANAGSTSGGVNITPFPTKWNMPNRLGPYEQNKQRWKEHSVANLVSSGKLKNGQLNIIFDCGIEDFFYKVNCKLDADMTARGIAHTYLTSHGRHNAEYWKKSIIPQLEFFSSRFNAL